MMHVTADFESDRFVIKCEDDPRTAALLKEHAHAKYDDRKRLWLAPKTAETVDTLNHIGADFSDAATEAAMWLSFDQESRSTASTADSGENSLGDFGRAHDYIPRPFQMAGINYLAAAGRAICGDDPGLGKTIQGLGFIHSVKALPALALCPAKLKDVWLEEANKAMPWLQIMVFDTKSNVEHTCNEQINLFKYNYTCAGCRFERADLVITNYDILADGHDARDKKKIKLSRIGKKLDEFGFRAIIADEAHYLSTYGSQRSKAAREIAKDIEYRAALTGTLVVNEPGELMSVLAFLDRLQDFGGYSNFQEQWVDSMTTMWRGKEVTMKQLETKLKAAADKFKPAIERCMKELDIKEGNRRIALNKKLRSICYIRRRKADVMKDLPPKVWQNVPIEIDNVAEYRKAEQEITQWAYDHVLEDKKFLSSIAGHPRATRELLIQQRQQEKRDKAEMAEEIVKISALQLLSARGKMKGVKAWLDEFLLGEGKAVVFGIHKEVIEQLVNWYPDMPSILSSTNRKQLDLNKKRFQEDPTARLMLCAMGMNAKGSPAGIGHTLTAGSYVFFIQMGWTRAHMKQCEDRCHRFDSSSWGHESINIYHGLGLVDGEETIDFEMARAIDRKKKVAEGIEDGIVSGGDADILDEMILYLANKGERNAKLQKG